MMWSPALLCLLVGFALARSYDNPAWDVGYQYVYQVRARSLVSVDQITSDYSGILLKAQLEVSPRSDGNLDARILQPQYAPIHGPLSEGWDQKIPDSQVAYQQLPLSSQPFQIELYDGAVRNVIVSKQIHNWEANLIKSFVSQLQLDTKAKNLIPSSINVLPEDESATDAVYKTMEETVTGVAETLYEIHPLNEYIVQSQPWLVPQKSLKQDGQIIQIVKTKNFTNSEQAPSFHFGFIGVENYEPSNQIANFLSRSSVSYAVITGDLKSYTIQNSHTVEEIVLSPTLVDKQKGSVHTSVNITLQQVAQQSQQNDNNVPNPVEVGLVYGYSSPYDNDNSPSPVKPYDHNQADASAEAQSGESEGQHGRRKRSISPPRSNYLQKSYMADNSDSSESQEEEQDWHQDKPKLSEAPQSPLLPYTVGYNGQSIKKQQNIIDIASKLAQKIGQELKQPKQIPEENTVGKFVTLTKLVRVMNAQEIQQVASRLYSPQENRPEASAWIAFRDAVAQSGTPPALQNIKEWIQTDKISKEEAASVISTAGSAAREPTEEYMQAFYQMLKDENIMRQPSLNESVLLSFTTLTHEVYASKKISHNKFPVHSYGTFRTERGQEFVKTEVIPFITRKLHQAIQQGNTQQIHVYIRALGNIGQKEILPAFEPYLEGTKKASHFQRLLMVVALNKLVESDPTVARSVLYKIYQNPSEYDQLRVSAVYQLMRANPSPEMLQRMATYTNVDPSGYVNAAVKSVIESAANLKGQEHAILRKAALAAQPHLTSQEYGYQYSQGKLRSYIVEEMELSYKQNFQLFSGEDSVAPQGVIYSLRSRFSGVKQKLVYLQAMVTSVEDLLAVFTQQTQKYQQEKSQKQQSQPEQHKWSSEYVANLLNMQNEQREQLEGNWYLRMGALQKIMSFDNQTIENLAQVISELEDDLRQGKSYNYEKMLIIRESVVAVPTALGFPFVYNYEIPVIVKLQANVKAVASPQVTSGDSFQKPNSVKAEVNVDGLVSARIQSNLGIFTPFDHQRYTAGYDRNLQVHVPVSANIELNLERQQLKIELDNPVQENVQLLHFSTWPYTAKSNIYNPKPEVNVIQKKHPQRFNREIGYESTGFVAKVEMTSDRQLDQAFIFEQLRRHDLISAMLGPWADDNIQFTNLNVVYSPSKSASNKIVIDLGYMLQHSQNQQGSNSQQVPPPQNLPSNIPNLPENPESRQKQVMEKITHGISNANGLVLDASVEFQGQKPIKYTATVGVGKSNVDPMSQFMVVASKDGKQSSPAKFYTYGVASFPNTNGLNLDYAMQMNPQPKISILALNEQDRRRSRIEAVVELGKSEERREYLQQQPAYQQCKQQMQQGNYQLPVCAKMTARANLLDQFSINVNYQDLDPQIINATYKGYALLRHFLYPRFEENIIAAQGSDRNQVQIEGQFSPDLHYLNFSLSSDYGKVKAQNIKINQWFKTLLVPQPVFHMTTRLTAQALKYDTYRPNCVLGKTQANTFDNKTYPSSLSSSFAVLLQYVPRRPSSVENQPDQSVLEQLQQLRDSYIVLARAHPQDPSQKEIKMVFQSPKTHGKIVEVSLKPSRGSGKPQVLVDGQEVQYSEQQAADLYDGHLQIYALPNQEVKLEIRDLFYIIFDGQTVKVTATGSKLRDAARGLCGTFTGEPETDFVDPQNNILQSPEAFVESYTVSDGQANPRQRPAYMAHREQTYQKKVSPVNYISDQDAGRQQQRRPNRQNSCTRVQTQYVEQGDEICFTLRPLPVCKQSCRHTGRIPKSVQVHCSRQTAATDLWKHEILKGASPDFSLKHPTKTIKMQVPQACVQ